MIGLGANMMNYAQIIEYVKEQTTINGRPPNYTFRSRFEHTMRVYRWAIKLQAKLGGDLEIIALAALFSTSFTDVLADYSRKPTTMVRLITTSKWCFAAYSLQFTSHLWWL